MRINPFVYGRPLDPPEMIGRKQQLQSILGRLVKRQSTAIIALPKSGKTTLLQVINDAEIREQVGDGHFQQDIFTFVDAHTLHDIENQAEFWQRVLYPLAELLYPQTAEAPVEPAQLEKRLHQQLDDHFNLDELKTLCFRMNIDYENLSGEGKSGKARELIIYCRNRNQTADLAAKIRALRPGYSVLQAETQPNPTLTTLATVYKTAQNNQFSAFVLEQLFNALHQNGRRFILILDEFDAFMSNAKLHTAEFYGSLRSLASRNPGFALIIAARQELEVLNRLTQEINPLGSPYFNIFTELYLGPLTHRELAELLGSIEDGRFTRVDRQFIVDLSGRHPFLAQAAASSLWDAHERKLTGNGRYQKAANTFYEHTKAHFVDLWQSLPDGGRKGVTALALQQYPSLVEGQTFHVGRLTENLIDYVPELEKIARNGLVAQTRSGEWHITQQGFLWWLADELRRHVHDETAFTDWLQQQTMSGVLTREEKQWLGRAATTTGQLLETGAESLIKAFVERFSAQT